MDRKCDASGRQLYFRRFSSSVQPATCGLHSLQRQQWASACSEGPGPCSNRVIHFIHDKFSDHTVSEVSTGRVLKPTTKDGEGEKAARIRKAPVRASEPEEQHECLFTLICSSVRRSVAGISSLPDDKTAAYGPVPYHARATASTGPLGLESDINGMRMRIMLRLYDIGASSLMFGFQCHATTYLHDARPAVQAILQSMIAF